MKGQGKALLRQHRMSAGRVEVLRPSGHRVPVVMKKRGAIVPRGFGPARGSGMERAKGYEATTKIAGMTPPDTPARKARTSAAQPVAASYEEALQELEALMARIEGGQLPLDQMLGQYQRASALLTYCREQLQAVEQQIKVLDGETLKPWDGA